MANVTLPTPVFIAGGALCLVAGYLIGTVAGPDTPQRTTATVAAPVRTSRNATPERRAMGVRPTSDQTARATSGSSPITPF